MDITGSGFTHDVEKKAYWSLIEGINDLYPGFVKNLAFQDDDQRNRGRVAVIEFHEGQEPHITDFGASGEALNGYFRSLASRPNSCLQSSSTQCRRMFVLEDLGRNKVQILGARLRIPPALFAAHWLDPNESLLSIDHNFLSHKYSKYFRCKVPQLHRLAQEDRQNYRMGLYEPLNMNVQRYLQLLDRDRTFESSQHQVSFWSTSFGNGSWTGEFTALISLYLSL